MKKSILMMMATAMLLAPGGAHAGFFGGQEAPEGSIELRFTDAAKIYVKDGFVFTLNSFVYDSDSHLAALAAGATPQERARKNSKKVRQSGGVPQGTIAIIKDEGIRSIFDSMAKQPNVWVSYLAGGENTCAEEKTLLDGLKFKSKLPANHIATTCSALRSRVDQVLGGLDSSEKQLISGGDTTRGKIISDHGLLPIIKAPFDASEAVAAIKEANKPSTLEAIGRLFVDLPPEEEIIPLIDVKEMVLTGETKKVRPGAMTFGRTVQVEREETHREPAILPHDIYKKFEVKMFLGDLAYTDGGDFLIDQLRNFDYALGNPSFTPGFDTDSRQVWLSGKTNFMVKSYVPRAMYAFSVAKNNNDGLNLSDSNWTYGQEDVGRFMAFPFMPEAGLAEYKTAWTTWHALLRKDGGLTKDEIRKLVLFGDVVRGGAMNEPFTVATTRTGKKAAAVASNPFGASAPKAVEKAANPFGAVTEEATDDAPVKRKTRRASARVEAAQAEKDARIAAREAKKAEREEEDAFPSFMGYYAKKAIAPVNMRALNLPSEWDVASPQTNDPDTSNPGLTVGRWYQTVLAAAGEKANANADFVSFTKALFAGDKATCKTIINKTVSDANLAAVVKKAQTNLAKADLPDTAKLGIGQSLANNKTGVYKSLSAAITAIYNPGAN